MIPAGHMQKCLWARAQNLPVQWVRNPAGSSLIPETAGLACSGDGEEMGIFIKKPPFSVTSATGRANESKSHLEHSPVAVALCPAEGRGEAGAAQPQGWDGATCPPSGACWKVWEAG